MAERSASLQSSNLKNSSSAMSFHESLDLTCINLYPTNWGNWHLFNERWLSFTLTACRYDNIYEVDLWEINNHQELVDWLFHVSDKTYDPADFFKAMRMIFRPVAWRRQAQFDGRKIVAEYCAEGRKRVADLAS
jgi:hypothetical protein